MLKNDFTNTNVLRFVHFTSFIPQTQSPQNHCEVMYNYDYCMSKAKSPFQHLCKELLAEQRYADKKRSLQT